MLGQRMSMPWHSCCPLLRWCTSWRKMRTGPRKHTCTRVKATGKTDCMCVTSANLSRIKTKGATPAPPTCPCCLRKMRGLSVPHPSAAEAQLQPLKPTEEEDMSCQRPLLATFPWARQPASALRVPTKSQPTSCHSHSQQTQRPPHCVLRGITNYQSTTCHSQPQQKTKASALCLTRHQDDVRQQRVCVPFGVPINQQFSTGGTRAPNSHAYAHRARANSSADTCVHMGNPCPQQCGLECMGTPCLQ